MSGIGPVGGATIQRMYLGMQSAASSPVTQRGPSPAVSGRDAYIFRIHLVSKVATTNDGSNYWSHEVWRAKSTGGAYIQVGSTATTEADGTLNPVDHVIEVNARYSYEDMTRLDISSAKTGSPGVVTVVASIDFILL